MNKLIIGLVGRVASGKGTAAGYWQEHYDATVFTYSQPLRDVLERLHLPVDRDHLIRMSETLRDKFGNDLFSRLMAWQAEQSESSIVVVDGIRRPDDIKDLLPLGLVLIEVEAESETRWRRLTSRQEKADDATKTLEEFQADEKRSTELTIDEVVGLAEVKIDNNGSRQALFDQIDHFMSSRQD